MLARTRFYLRHLTHRRGCRALKWPVASHSCRSVFVSCRIEFEGRQRWWLIGACLGVALLNRAPAGLSILFFGAFIFLNCQHKAITAAKLCLPFAAAVAALGVYNFARFGSPLESGYGLQVHGPSGLLYSVLDVPGNAPGRLFSASNIPRNLWTFLFGLPEVRAVGTSVFIVSPYLVYLTRVRWDLTNKLLALSCLVVLLALLAFRSTGFEQMGYRFSLDFLPFVFWLLIRSEIATTKYFKTLIFAGSVIDLCLVKALVLRGAMDALGELGCSRGTA